MIGSYIIRLEEITSTNRYASELLAGPYTIRDGTVVIADHQSLGKGAGDRG